MEEGLWLASKRNGKVTHGFAGVLALRHQRDDASGDHAITAPEAALVCACGPMAQARALSLEGTVVAVAADRGHHFSRPP